MSDYAVPDLIEPLYGWRYWDVPREGDSLRKEEGLYSVWHGNARPWTPRQPREASCPNPNHVGPRIGCVCGIHAHRKYQPVPHSGGLVMGSIVLWGRVVEYTGGWRAQYGYPTLLIVRDPSRMILRIAELYGVPVMTPQEFREEREVQDAALNHA